MLALTSHDVVSAIIEGFTRLMETIDSQVRDIEPTTWVVIALICAAVWIRFVKPR